MQENISSIFPEIENKIFTVRGLPVMLDSDLALLYGVETKRINQSVKRNINRFPEWFMFQMTYTEWENLKCQFGNSNKSSSDSLRSQIATSSENNNPHEKDSRFQMGTSNTSSGDSLRSQSVTLEKKINEQENYSRSQFATLNDMKNLEEENLRSQNATIEEINIEQEKDSRSQIVTLNENKHTEAENLRSQIPTSSNEEDKPSRFQIGTLKKTKRGTNLKYLPFAFTEQGVAMLSAVLKSETAVKISIQIMAAFVALRKLHYQSAGLYQRLELVEKKQIEADNHFNTIFSALEKKDKVPSQGVFFNGQIFDAYKFIADIIKSATTSIILIDNYIDETTLALLSKRNTGVTAIIYSDHLSRNQIIDLQKLNAQYETIEIKKLKHNHDRFLIIDQKEMYHFGASLKDLGKKIFGFSKMDNEVGLMMERLDT